MRSWITLITCTTVFIILTLVEADERPKRGDDYGFDVSVPGLGAYGGPGHISTGFNCEEMPFPGIYADVNTGCKSFHICRSTSGSGSTSYCPKGTLFNQQHFVCDWWYNVNCEASTQYYDLNAKLQGKGGPHYYGSAQDHGQDIFQALLTAKESASIAADHAAIAADAASAAKSAAEAKQISSQQQIHAIKASAQSQLNAARRAAQIATSHAHSRAAAAHRSATAFEAEVLSKADAVVNDASAVKADANVQFAIAKAASEAQKNVQVAKLHLDIQEGTRNKALDRQAELAFQPHSNVNVGHLVASAAAEANKQSNVANLHLAIQEGVRNKHFDHQSRDSQFVSHKQTNDHLAGVIANAAANANGQKEVANLHLAIQEGARQKYYDHQTMASQSDGRKQVNGHLTATIPKVIAHAAQEANGKGQLTNLHLSIQEQVRQKHYDHQPQASGGQFASAVTAVIADAADQASGKAQAANLQLGIQKNVRQNTFAKQQSAARRRHGQAINPSTISHIVENSAAKVIQKKNVAKHQPFLSTHQQRRHYVRAATKHTANARAMLKAKQEAKVQTEDRSTHLDNTKQQRSKHHRRHSKYDSDINSGRLAAEVTGVIAEAAVGASRTLQVANLQLDIQEKGRQNAFEQKGRVAQDSHGHDNRAAEISEIVSNAAAEAGQQEDMARQQLSIQDKVRHYSSAHYNRKPEGHRRHYVRAAILEDVEAVSESVRRQDNGNDTLMSKAVKEVTNKPDESARSMDNAQKQRTNRTSEQAKDGKGMNPTEGDASLDTKEKEVMVPTQRHRKRRGYHGGYINVGQIIQNAASGASMQADTARLYVDIRAKARQEHYNQHVSGHHRRHAAASGRSDGKEEEKKKAGRANEKQSAMHYGDEKEADATKVTTNPTSEADRKANPINPKSHQRKARGIYPCHRCNVWQIIGNAAAEANGQTEVARLNLQIQEKARQSHQPKHRRATQQAQYGN